MINELTSVQRNLAARTGRHSKKIWDIVADTVNSKKLSDLKHESLYTGITLDLIYVYVCIRLRDLQNKLYTC